MPAARATSLRLIRDGGVVLSISRVTATTASRPTVAPLACGRPLPRRFVTAAGFAAFVLAGAFALPEAEAFRPASPASSAITPVSAAIDHHARRARDIPLARNSPRPKPARPGKALPAPS